ARRLLCVGLSSHLSFEACTSTKGVIVLLDRFSRKPLPREIERRLIGRPMSAFGQKRTSRSVEATSALPKSGHWNSTACRLLCAKNRHSPLHSNRVLVR